MNEYLAEIYGTMSSVEPEEENFQKEAAVQTLVKIAEAEGINLDDLSDEEVSQLLKEVEQGQEAAGDSEKEVKAALETGDMIGRTAAHAYVAELREIEKQAGARWDAVKAFGSKALGKINSATGLKQFREGRKGLAEIRQAVKGSPQVKNLKGKEARSKIKEMMGSYKTSPLAQAYGEGKKKLLTRVALPAAGAIGLGTGAAMMNKKSADEAFEEAATERAWEMLAEAGYDVEKMAQDSQVQEVIEARALEMLGEAGYLQ